MKSSSSWRLRMTRNVKILALMEPTGLIELTGLMEKMA